ncbi:MULTISPECIES: DUF4810 domain-containing protein [Uliginosibacterium]|uniref:DUF4810 domain-containing protein n=1 Tax=Uliginosibacterium aquaticum TaxID=2731212 RepID=A0ABX2IJG4_9RHOO|nr:MULTISPECIES: DUF4810 domain-containing protein [Uliginosibacterium]MDO6386453.1 DUF4810 domain-containing protein [Uliginosibacterium sp. 31-12]NSL56973.1 DUF4810 domain-containing protein [Uliginosibacterium aquaticum]PLK50295.1 DUF4810 domain-containing protein [Uliginosibacterium sp. TH139]
MRIKTTLGGLLLAALLAGGCATRTPTLYYWGDYQPQLYAYLKNEGSSHPEQILALQKIIEEAKAANKSVPPGFYAHLGLLQINEGKPELARQAFETEKTLFPESAAYMDFLLRKLAGGKA